MLSGHEREHLRLLRDRLNAPCGAGCFLTVHLPGAWAEYHRVLMHLLVLGAF